MSYTSELKALREEIAGLRHRVDEIDNNTIGHLDRILENQKQGAPTPTPQPMPQPTPEPTPTPAPPSEYPGIEAVRQEMQRMDLQTAANKMENAWAGGFGDKDYCNKIALVINERWPSQWRTLPQRVSGLIEGILHALGGQGV